MLRKATKVLYLFPSSSLFTTCLVIPVGIGLFLSFSTLSQAEDFGFISEVVPSLFLLVGQGGKENEEGDVTEFGSTKFGLHNPSFTVDERVLMTGVELHVRVALESLRELWAERERK